MNDDLVRRSDVYQFAKEQLEKETGAYRTGRNDGLRVMMAAAKNPDAIPTVDIPKWISVKDKIPDVPEGNLFSDDVYVTDGETIVKASLMCRYDGDTPEWTYTGIGEITHWCKSIPLPKKEAK